MLSVDCSGSGVGSLGGSAERDKRLSQNRTWIGELAPWVPLSFAYIHMGVYTYKYIYIYTRVCVCVGRSPRNRAKLGESCFFEAWTRTAWSVRWLQTVQGALSGGGCWCHIFRDSKAWLLTKPGRVYLDMAHQAEKREPSWSLRGSKVLVM